MVPPTASQSAQDHDALAFLAMYEEDRSSGSVRKLHEYLQMWPRSEQRIALEWIELHQPQDNAVADGMRIGRYEIIDELGRGGQGVVYRAVDTQLGRTVALKTFRSGNVLKSQEGLLRFRREAAVASQLDHPGICAVFDAGTADNVTYIAMRYIAGESLAAHLAKDDQKTIMELSRLAGGDETDDFERTLRESDRSSLMPTTRNEIGGFLGLIEKVARALHVAHEAGIVHRDVKPGNIMLGADGEPTILDFGLAHAESEDSNDPTLTRSGDVFGTPAYMSPEQVAGLHEQVDRRSDIYSLGVTLFQALTNERPFDAPGREALYRAIMEGNPKNIRVLNPNLAPDLKVVLDAAMAKDPRDRYQTALAFAEDLRRLREFEPVAAKRAGTWLRFRRWTQRSPAVALSVLGIFLSLLAGLGLSLFLLQERGEALQEKNHALTRFERLADSRRLEVLLKEADEDLWPRHPSKEPSVLRWLDQARRLLESRPLHEGDLKQTRARALPLDAVGLSVDAQLRRRQYPKLFQDLEKAQAIRAKSLSELALLEARTEVDQDAHAEIKKALFVAEASIERIEADPRLSERITWVFADDESGWRAQVLEEVLTSLAHLEERVPDVEARLSYLRHIEHLSLVAPESRWKECIASIAQSDRYQGLSLEPQLELVPLREDPESGLWEFVHLGSGVAPEIDPETGRYLLTGDTGLVMILVPGLSFQMGAQSASQDEPGFEPLSARGEAPVHRVELAPFFFSKYEMTQGQWLRFPVKNPSHFRAGDNSKGGTKIDLTHPVHSLTWEMASERMKALGLRLCTEAQWEAVARSFDTKWASPAEAFEALSASVANLDDDPWRLGEGVVKSRADAFDATAPVDAFPPNAMGFHGMVGNVYEWCQDRWGRYQIPVREGDGLRHVVWSPYRVLRGGSFARAHDAARAAARNAALTTAVAGDIGCRPVRPLDIAP